jgi:hypothetical protein
MAPRNKELSLLKNIIKTYHKYTDDENEYRRNPSEKSFDRYRKSEIDFITAIYVAEEYIEKIESKE